MSGWTRAKIVAMKTMTYEERMAVIAQVQAYRKTLPPAVEEEVEEPTMLILFREGTLDLKSLTGQNLRDLWCLLLGEPTGRKTSPGMSNKKALIMRCIELGKVMHLYPEV